MKKDKSSNANEDRFRELMEHLNTGVYRNTPGSRGRFLEVNSTIVRMFDYSSKEEFMKIPVAKLYKDPKLREEFNESMIRNGSLQHKELELVRRDGSTFWGSVSGVAVRDPNGAVIYFDGTIEDITFRKQEESELQQSLSLLNSTLESTADGILVVDNKGSVIKSNRKFLDMWRIPDSLIESGYDDQLLAYVNNQLMFPEKFISKVRQLYDDADQVSEDIIEFLDGRLFERYSQPYRIGTEIAGRVWSFRDVTQRKKAEQALRESEARNRAILDALPDLMFVHDSNGTYLDYHTTRTEALYTSPAQFMGKTIRQIFSPELASVFMDMTSKVIGTRKLQTYEYQLPIAGMQRFFEARLAPYVNDKVLSIIRDITDRKIAEEEVQKLAMVVTHLSELVNIAAVDGKMTFLNEAGQKMLGLTPEEVPNTRILQVIPDHLQKRAKKEILPIVLSEGNWEGDLQYLNLKTGTMTDVHAIIFTINDPDSGKPLYLVNVSLDITDRKRAEDNLKNSEKRFKILFDYAPEAYYLADLKGSFIDGNIAAEEILGYKKEEVLGKSFLELNLLPPNQLLRAGKLLTRNLLGKDTGPDEFDLYRKDGSVVTVEISTHPVRINDQMVILGIARDITARKLTEKQLQESNIRFQHISSSISDISFSCINDKNGKYRIEWIYGATEKITGYTIQELITMGYWENLVLETDLPVFKEHFLQIPPGSFDTCQFRIQHKDGRMIWIESSVECVRRLDVPHLTYLYGGMVDISARMQYIRELHESEQKFRSLVENAFDGIYLTNGRYFTYANKKFCEITGFTEKELTSGNFDFDILLSENVQIEVRKRTVRRKQGKYVPSLFEFEIITKEGLIKHVEVSTVDVSTESEFLVLGIVRDISERKKVESQMIQSGRLSALGEMAAGIAHEINQPLNTLSLAFDNILMEAQDKPSVNAKYLNSKSQKINDSILRIRNIIDHIRAFSRNQEGYLFSAFNINESIKNAVSLVSEQYRITGIELFVNLEPTVHSIIGNTYRFEQVILNLLSNAKDALMEKKEKLRQSYPMFVRISTIKNDPNTTIEVQDNGIGIPAENIDKTILPFYTTKETGKGTGLGLSISHGIINEMNGTLQIQSKVMEGTTIRITLPEKPEKN